jgi:hypothetical protein
VVFPERVVKERVTVDEDQVVGGGLPNGLVGDDGLSESPSGCQTWRRGKKAGRRYPLEESGDVGPRAVVGDEDLEITVLWRFELSRTSFQEPRVLVDGHQDAGSRVGSGHGRFHVVRAPFPLFVSLLRRGRPLILGRPGTLLHLLEPVLDDGLDHVVLIHHDGGRGIAGHVLLPVVRLAPGAGKVSFFARVTARSAALVANRRTGL